jgi:50S ribosomal protein L16 3-hydroxylase
MNPTLLGGLSASSFLRRHWQKLPLLIRAAMPELRNTLTLQQLVAMSRSESCEARLVVADEGRYDVLYGPLTRRIVRELPQTNWTLLVQGVNHVFAPARDLLQRFSFLPFARLDDVMVSFAAPGGGVGPHFDSYDVFLLQARGRRLWQVGAQKDLELLPDSELRILRRFRPDGSCTVSPGDMLYLPPRFAHNGTALDSCITYSIGFRAPNYEELKSQFLAFLDDSVQLEGRYADPHLRATSHPGRLGTDMVERIARKLSRIRWTRADITAFLGRYLSEPKPYIVLGRPRALDYNEFHRRVEAEGVEMHPALPLLFCGKWAFINGDAIDMKPDERRTVILLADQRRLTPRQARNARAAMPRLHSWYGNGYIFIGNSDLT